jgi:hypothetical protein
VLYVLRPLVYVLMLHLLETHRDVDDDEQDKKEKMNGELHSGMTILRSVSRETLLKAVVLALSMVSSTSSKFDVPFLIQFCLRTDSGVSVHRALVSCPGAHAAEGQRRGAAAVSPIQSVFFPGDKRGEDK